MIVASNAGSNLLPMVGASDAGSELQSDSGRKHSPEFLALVRATASIPHALAASPHALPSGSEVQDDSSCKHSAEFLASVRATGSVTRNPDSLRSSPSAVPELTLNATCGHEHFDMSYSDSDGAWTIAGPKAPASVSMVSFAPECQVSSVHQDVEIVLDSGADRSCLPAEYASSGVARNAPHAVFRDAQGNVIKPTAVRNAKVDLGHVTFNETWIVGPITAPLHSLGKLYRQGFTIGRVNNELTLHREGDAMNGAPVYLKHNSLCARGSIRVVSSQASGASNATEPSVVSSASASCEPLETLHVNALNITLYGPWLGLRENFVEVSAGLIANKCVSLGHVDCTLAFPLNHTRFRTTLHSSPIGWVLYALNEDLSSLEDFEVPFPGNRLYETITIGSSYRIDIRQLFPEHVDRPVFAAPVIHDESEWTCRTMPMLQVLTLMMRPTPKAMQVPQVRQVPQAR